MVHRGQRAYRCQIVRLVVASESPLRQSWARIAVAAPNPIRSAKLATAAILRDMHRRAASNDIRSPTATTTPISGRWLRCSKANSTGTTLLVMKCPAEMGGPEVEAFLTHLAADRQLSVSSHRQALSALLFLYGKVLGQQLPWMQQIGRPVPRRRLPTVLAPDEVAAVLARMSGVHGLLARLLYGTGMRISEGLQLRVKDIDFAHRAVIVREGKGGKDRVVMLPLSLVQALREHLTAVRAVWASDVEDERSGVELPHALERKFPRAGQRHSRVAGRDQRQVRSGLPQ